MHIIGRQNLSLNGWLNMREYGELKMTPSVGASVNEGNIS